MGGERHLVGATDFGLPVRDLGRESIGRKPSRHRIRIDERAIDFFRGREASPA